VLIFTTTGLSFSARSAKENGADPLTGNGAFAADTAGAAPVPSDPASPMLGPTEKRSTPAMETAKNPISKIKSTMKKGCLYLKSIFIKSLPAMTSPGSGDQHSTYDNRLIY
jgi:hypothetical protein